MAERALKSRREFLRTSAGGALVVSVAASMTHRGALAGSHLPQLDPEHPVAQALTYTHDATTSARPSDDQGCDRCLQYTGSDGDEWGPCNIFPENLVNANGWCSAFVPKS